ncbi:MAG: hypothetical protein LKG79_06690 [Furfurilactobacillus sp.]|jgi:hypothetical protein|uniref:Uncharacterized protein n=1 Tax=Furfurilactobacillus milii TaxID=2888272 RepID=A0ABT6DB52_9LACO|nr:MULTISPECIES: hypothetical protein [Furfurilactobacillus]QLE66799.1 hypothetical protein LROSL2_1449 [Furfurilactobacillus rossiae]MCF6160684.1 hypothetical protein [Furfurilactobacillus milii]MCF6162916.1 hypothetical protein [Furfurilactobacillus milii]MCF6420164.1 hypothetical protein [Furfurilactobacillus milii]MCH4010433.1 hypothetical protein [Furfurilactobacillus sp.]
MAEQENKFKLDKIELDVLKGKIAQDSSSIVESLRSGALNNIKNDKNLKKALKKLAKV